MPDWSGTRWRPLGRIGFIVLLQSAPTHRASGQAIPKPDYVTYLPRDVALPVQATSGTRLFHLFGDSTTPGYRDAAPRDGIDDARALWLGALAVRFAPWMVRNSVDFPMNFRPFIEGGDASTLFVDAFDLSQARPRLLDTKAIDFGRLTGATCNGTTGGTGETGDSTPDCRLLELVHRFAPVPPPAADPPRPDLDIRYVMYFDFPGQDPASWNREFEGSVHGAIARKYLGYAKAFVHPFISEVRGPGFEPPRYELVLQYWFFYPYNDAGNVHEGDWEHINVVVTPQRQGTQPLAAAAMGQLLEQQPAPDQLLIRRVEYYFHHWVFIADYMTPDVYARRASPLRPRRTRSSASTTPTGSRSSPTGSRCCRWCGRILSRAGSGPGWCCRSASAIRRPGRRSPASCATPRPGTRRSSHLRTTAAGTAPAPPRATSAIGHTGWHRSFRPASRTTTGRGGDFSTSRCPRW